MYSEKEAVSLFLLRWRALQHSQFNSNIFMERPADTSATFLRTSKFAVKGHGHFQRHVTLPLGFYYFYKVLPLTLFYRPTFPSPCLLPIHFETSSFYVIHINLPNTIRLPQLKSNFEQKSSSCTTRLNPKWHAQ
jgi:hypothetical protein